MRRGIAIVLGATMTLGTVDSSHAVEALATGTATYELDLAEAGPVGNVAGTMVATIRRECDAYRSETTMSVGIAGPDGVDLTMDLHAIHVEDPTSLAFDVRGELATMEFDRALGLATKTAGGLQVALSEPQDETLSFDGEILFPLEMVLAAIDAARSGESFEEFHVYDGSGFGEEVWSTSVVISAAPRASEEDDAALFAAGLGFGELARWRMRFTYFPPAASGEQTPAFSAEGIVYENGFMQAGLYDFGQFALRLNLVEFSPIAPTPCQQERTPQK